jgi:hypothetical protein
VDNDLRASLVAAAAAIALSALIGFIAGVALVALLVRALVFGAVAGGACYGCIALIKNMLPEVLEPQRAARETLDRAESEEAHAVDIVLPGDEAAPEYLRGGEEPPQRDAASRDAASEDFSPMPGDGSAIEEESLLDGVIGKEAEGAAAMPSAHRASDPGVPSSRQLFDELDVLPDLDGFTDSFTASEFASGGAPSSEALRSGPSSSTGAGRDGMSDPAALAQAVRTILKRDQKG